MSYSISLWAGGGNEHRKNAREKGLEKIRALRAELKATKNRERRALLREEIRKLKTELENDKTDYYLF